MLLKNDQEFHAICGFTSPPANLLWKNTRDELGKISTVKYFNKTTISYHNLYTKHRPTTDLGALLGLGLKFCLKTPEVNRSSLNNAFKRIQKYVRTKYFFADAEEANNYNPKLYICSDWTPLHACA